MTTAVIPAFNAAAHIAEAIASLQRQLSPPTEIIVVDDGSADATAAVSIGAGARVIRQENGGPAAARNAGIRVASSDWIALLDADDVARPNRLAQQIPLTHDSSVAVVFGRHVAPNGLQPARTGIDVTALWKRNQIPTSTVLLRRCAWDAVGGFDEDRALIGVEDYNLWLRLAHAGWTFAFVDEVLVDYRPSANSLSAQTRRFAAAELENARRISAQLGFGSDALRSKEHAIYLEYGFELFHSRDLTGAYEFLSEAAQRGPLGVGGQMRRAASLLPYVPRLR